MGIIICWYGGETGLEGGDLTTWIGRQKLQYMYLPGGKESNCMLVDIQLL